MNRAGMSLPARLTMSATPLALLLALGVVAGLAVGSSDIPASEALAAVFAPDAADPAVWAIVWKLRLPRTLLAALAGGALSLSGLVFQVVLGNPLAEPYILGVSGGAALGMVAGVLLGVPASWGSGPLAFAGALAAFGVVLGITRRRGMSSASLVLSGVMINAFCSAVIMFFVSIARDHTLRATLVWLMGDTSMANTRSLLVPGVCVPALSVLVFVLSHRMNLLLLGAEAAANLGVRVPLVKIALVVAATVMTAAVVSQTGILGFVGLVCPHILRLLLGHDHRVLVPCCALFGAGFLVCCDVGSRLLSHQGAMPVGVLTAMIGAPVFLFLLTRSRP